jgi:tetratricopeptide (TPR) repeat protein
MMRAIKLACTLTVIAGNAICNNPAQEGIRAFQDGRYSVAEAELQKATDTRSKAFLALTRAALGNCKAALPGLLSAPETDTEIFRLTRIGAVKCYASANALPKAFALLDNLEQRFPSDADVLYLAAKLHMKAFNDATLAMFQRAPSSYRVHELSGEIFEVEDRFSDAAAEYRKAIAENPTAPDLHFRLGRAILLESHSAEALKAAAAEFQSELKLNPEDSACEFQLGQIAQVQGATADAVPHLERALQSSPDFVQALIALGKIKTQTREYTAAIDLLSRAVKLQPDNETAHYALLTAYRDSGQLNKASLEKAELDRLQRAPEGEFSDFLKKLGEKPPQ